MLPGMPDSASMPGQLVVDRVRHQLVPRLACLHLQLDPDAVVRTHPDPAGADGDHVAGPAGIRCDDVGATTQHQQRAAGGVGGADGADQLAGVVHLHQPVHRPAHGQGGELGQRDPGQHLHAPTVAMAGLGSGADELLRQ